MTDGPQPSDEKKFLALVQEWHEGGPRRDQVGHCLGVKERVEHALALEETEVAARRDILLAALGHDLYEDTEVPRQDIVDGFGSEVDALIRWLTEGASVPEYVEQVAKSPEEARLIKYADLADNYGGLVANGLLNADPAKWVEKVRHKMEPMFERLSGVPFQKYPKAGAWLAEQARMRRESFWAEARKIRPDLG